MANNASADSSVSVTSPSRGSAGPSGPSGLVGPIQNICCDHILGQGTYGRVYDVQGTRTAWKVLEWCKWTDYIGPSAREAYMVGFDDASAITFTATSGEMGMLTTRKDCSVWDLIEAECAPLPLGVVADIVQGAATSLAAMHTHGFVHHDVKPSNIMLNLRGARIDVSIIDFSLSSHGQPAFEVYTLLWRAPEVLLGLPHTAAADVWALGVIMLELTTGGRLTEVLDVDDTLDSLGDQLGIPSVEQYPRLHEVRDRLPPHGKAPTKPVYWPPSPEVAHLIQSMLAWNPQHRPRMSEVAASTLWPWIRERCSNHVSAWLDSVEAPPLQPLPRPLSCRTEVFKAEPITVEALLALDATLEAGVRTSLFDCALRAFCNDRWSCTQFMQTMYLLHVALATSIGRHAPQESLAAAVIVADAVFGGGSMLGNDALRACRLSPSAQTQEVMTRLVCVITASTRPQRALDRGKRPFQALASALGPHADAALAHAWLLWAVQWPSFWCTDTSELVSAALHCMLGSLQPSAPASPIDAVRYWVDDLQASLQSARRRRTWSLLSHVDDEGVEAEDWLAGTNLVRAAERFCI